MSISNTSTPKPTEGYLSLPVATLLPERAVGVDLYIRHLRSGPLRLYRASRIPLEEDDLSRLANRGVRVLYMRKSAHARYQAYLKENIATLIADESQSVTSRFSALNEVVRDVLESSFRKGDTDETVRQSERLADHCVDLLSRDDYSETELMDVLHHDYHTFTHSANVSYLAVILARSLGMTDQETVRQIAVGGLLHDLGKMNIPHQLLTKPARLTEREFDIVRNHPIWGLEKLGQRDDLSQGQLMMVYQHHERVAGGGYPVGCRQREIHDWARICTVVDVYEALKANRPYRDPLPIGEIIGIMTRDSGKVFDQEMLQCWLKVIKPS